MLKREITFEVTTFGGSLNSGCRYFRDLLTPVKFYSYFRKGRYFRVIVTFGTLRYFVIITTVVEDKTFSNSLIIHKEKTKEIITMMVVWMPDLD